MNHAHIAYVEIVFDWQNAPEVKSGAAPSTMSLYMFPVDGGESMRFEFTNYQGGTIRIPVGEYRGFCINSDTEVIRYRNTESFETFELITRNTSTLSGLMSISPDSENAPRAQGTESERTAYSPDSIWSDRQSDITIAESETKQILTFYPSTAVCRYTVEVINAENLKYILGVSGSLSSMTEGYIPGRDALGNDRVTIPFETSYSIEERKIQSEFLTFGHCYESSAEHQMIIYAIMGDGRKLYYTFNVTEQIHNAPDQRNVHIIIDGLPLPKPITNGGGFIPEVSDWETEEIELTM